MHDLPTVTYDGSVYSRVPHGYTVNGQRIEWQQIPKEVRDKFVERQTYCNQG